MTLSTEAMQLDDGTLVLGGSFGIWLVKDDHWKLLHSVKLPAAPTSDPFYSSRLYAIDHIGKFQRGNDGWVYFTSGVNYLHRMNLQTFAVETLWHQRHDFTGTTSIADGDIALAPSGAIWATGVDLGIIRHWPDGAMDQTLQENWLPDKSVQQVLFDAKGGVWLATRKGLGFRAANGTGQILLANQPVYRLYEHKDRIYALLDQGVTVFDLNAQVVNDPALPMTLQQTQGLNFVTAPGQDLWACGMNGLWQLHDSRWQFADCDCLPDDNPKCWLAFDSATGDRWVLSPSGLYKNPPYRLLPDDPGDLRVLHWKAELEKKFATMPALAKDRQDRLWCVYPPNVWIYDGKQWLNFTPQLKLPAGTMAVGCLTDRTGTVWIQTYAGLFSVDGETITRHLEKELGANGSVSSMEEDKQGRLWALGEGILYCREQGQWHKRAKTQYRWGLMTDSANRLWMYDNTYGVAYYVDDKIHAIDDHGWKGRYVMWIESAGEKSIRVITSVALSNFIEPKAFLTDGVTTREDTDWQLPKELQ